MTITYEELLNSHFMKFPGHNKFVYKIFGPFLIIAITLTAVFLTNYIYSNEIGMSLIGTAFVGLLMGKSTMAMLMIRGHGVLQKNWKYSIFKMPRPMALMFALLFIVIAAMCLLSVSPYLTLLSKGNIQILSFSLMTGLIMIIFSWRFHIYYETYYGNEYDAHIELRNKGLSQYEIEESIEILRRKGVFG